MPRMPRFARRPRPERRARAWPRGTSTSRRCRAAPWPTASGAGSWRTCHAARRPSGRSRSPWPSWPSARRAAGRDALAGRADHHGGRGARRSASWTFRRGQRRLGFIAMSLAVMFGFLGAFATQSSVGNLESVFVWSGAHRGDAALRDPAHLRRGRRHVLRAQRRREHRPRGHDADGRVLRDPRRRQARLLGPGARRWRAIAGGLLALVHAFFSIHLRADQILSGTAIWFLALGLTGYLFIDIYGPEGTPGGISSIPDVNLSFLDGHPVPRGRFADLNLMIWLGASPRARVVRSSSSGRRSGCACARSGEHPRAAETVGLRSTGSATRP